MRLTVFSPAHQLWRRFAPAAVTGALTAGLCTAALAALPAHLTPAGWDAIAKFDANAQATNSVPWTRAQCAQQIGTSSDPEVRGVLGICDDSAKAAVWSLGFAVGCANLATASAASRAKCAEALTSLGANLSAAAQWAGWFVARLGPGGCHNEFAYMQSGLTQITSVIAHFASDLRRGAPTNQLLSDQRHFESVASSSSPAANFAACKP